MTSYQEEQGQLQEDLLKSESPKWMNVTKTLGLMHYLMKMKLMNRLKTLHR